MKVLQASVLTFAVSVFAVSASAAPISIFSVPDNTYTNSTNNPCIFFGPGGSGCNSNPAFFPFVGDTGGGSDFVPNPLTNTLGDAPGELLSFATNVGRDFLIGLDINQSSTAQTLSNLTINFLDVNGVVIGTSYAFAPAMLVPDNANGVGYADYLLAAGGTVGSPTAFSAPTGTRQITFTFGMTGFNDGPDKLFLISVPGCPTCGPTPFNIEPVATPEPASMLLLGSGLALIAVRLRKRKQ